LFINVVLVLKGLAVYPAKTNHFDS